VAHHSSRDYNLSTALRQGAGEALFSWLFYLPMAFFCPPDVYALHRGLNTVYQFFVHTQLVGRCWWPIELVMNTPSHHRVHHARNYGRRNFAGILIVWDRLLGSFEEEQASRPCVYGLDASPIVQGTYNPLWHQAHHLVATLRLAGSGKVPVWRALLTRAHGPGMVAPTVTDAEPPAGAPSSTTAGTAGTARSAAKGAPMAAAQPAQQPSQAAVPPAGAGLSTAFVSYPWERRALGPLDWYAAASFFLVTLPCSLAYLLAAADGILSPGWTLAGGAWAAWAVTGSAWLFGGMPAAQVHEMARLLAQLGAVLGLLRWDALPPPLSSWLARGAAVLSLASLVFLYSQAAQLRQACGGTKTARAASGQGKKAA
jgi:hypothetical protein